MASTYTDVVPTTQSITSLQSLQQQLALVTKNSAGGNVDITAWNTVVLQIFPPGGSANASSLVDQVLTLTGGSGLAKAVIPASVTANLTLGSFLFDIVGSNLVTDDQQLLCSGTWTSKPSF